MPGARTYGSEVLVTAREAQEYRAFFALTDADLAGRVLDCCAGASSFTATVNHRGGRAVALDPAYSLHADELERAARRSLIETEAMISAHPDSFVWDWHLSPASHAARRRRSLGAFLTDYARRPGTYVAGALPRLPFADDAFDLALCSHLLFTWSDELDAGWHTAALLELLRVAPEVRVFPLVTAGTGEPVPFLGHVLRRLADHGHTASTAEVTYRFQRGATTMLRLTRHRGAPTLPGPTSA